MLRRHVLRGWIAPQTEMVINIFVYLAPLRLDSALVKAISQIFCLLVDSLVKIQLFVNGNEHAHDLPRADRFRAQNPLFAGDQRLYSSHLLSWISDKVLIFIF